MTEYSEDTHYMEEPRCPSCGRPFPTGTETIPTHIVGSGLKHYPNGFHCEGGGESPMYARVRE